MWIEINMSKYILINFGGFVAGEQKLMSKRGEFGVIPNKLE